MEKSLLDHPILGSPIPHLRHTGRHLSDECQKALVETGDPVFDYHHFHLDID